MEKHQIFKITELLSICFTLPLRYMIEYYFYKRFLGFKNKIWKFALFAFLLTVVDFNILHTLPLPLRIFLSNLIWLIIISFLCKGNLLIKSYAVVVQESGLLIIELIFLTFNFKILPLTHNINMSFYEHIIIGFINYITITYVHFVILFIFLKNICNLLNLKEKTLNLYQSLYLLIPCLSIYSLALIFHLIQTITINNKNYYLPNIFGKLYYILPFVCFALLISILIAAYTFKKMLEGEEEHQNNKLMEQQFKLQLIHSKNIEKVYTGVRSVMHDMNNHLSCLKNLADADNIDEIKKYLNNIGQTIKKLDFQIKTGNSISDAIINEKYNIAKAEGIEFICDFMIPKESLIQSIDLCIILSNTLDNAIEACMRITDNKIPKTIKINSYIRDMYLIIEVSNTFIDTLHYEENKIVSTKSDKYNHGFGLSNVKSTVKKYNGIVDITVEKSKFIINLMIKIK